MSPTTVTILQVGMGLMTFFAGFYSNIAPPDDGLKLWPSVATILAILGFFIYRNAGPKLQKLIVGISIAIAFVGPIFYVWRYQNLTAKYASSRVICGTELTQHGSGYKSRNPGISNEQLIFDFAGETTDIWTESSINRARLTLGLSYSAGFGFLALATLIVLQKSKRPLPQMAAEPLESKEITVDKPAEPAEPRYDHGGVSVSTPVEVFFSYAHEDEELRDEIAKHLRLLERQGVIKGWHDREIGPGSRWRGAIDERLKSARIILLLVSADFLSSDYCYEIEMKTALELDEQNKARVIPIIVRDCDWQSAPFGYLQTLPQGEKPITQWNDRDAALKNIALGIRQAVREFDLKDQ